MPGTRHTAHRHMSPLTARGFTRKGVAHTPSRAMLKHTRMRPRKAGSMSKTGGSPCPQAALPQGNGLLQSLTGVLG